MLPRVTRTMSSATPDPDVNSLADIQDCTDQLTRVEDKVLQSILFRLEQEFDLRKRNRDRAPCDRVFGVYTRFIYERYADAGMASRAALFSASTLIPAVLDLEARKGCEFHKGGLFYDTALAFLISGDEARFEYYLAMADEEDYLTHAVEGKARERGMHNRKLGTLTSQTIQASVFFAVQVANGSTLSAVCPVATLLGGPLTGAKVDTWRANLDVFHHAELFRTLNEFRVFCGDDVAYYTRVRDNPYVMLRLGKVHAFLRAVAPFRDGLLVACECMHCWYWLADTCRDQNIKFPTLPERSVAPVGMVRGYGWLCQGRNRP
jgi:hypothetical protein